MVVMDLLFKTDTGLMSLFTIGFVIVMAIFFLVWFNKKSHDPNA